MVIGSYLSALGCSAILFAAAPLDNSDSEPTRPPAANLGLRLADRPAAVASGADQDEPAHDEGPGGEVIDAGPEKLPEAQRSESVQPDASPMLLDETSQQLGQPQPSLGSQRDQRIALVNPPGDGDDATWMPAGLQEIAQVGGALTLVVSLLLISRRMLARSSRLLAGGSRPSGVLEVLGRYPVGRGQSLVLLKFARRILLLHQSGASMTMITELTSPEDVAALLARVEAGSSGRDVLRFRSLLRQYQHEHEHPSERSAQSRRRTGIELQTENVSLDQDVDLVDLTRSRNGVWFGGLFGRKGRGS